MSTSPAAAPGKKICPACNAEVSNLKTVSGVTLCDKCASKKFSTDVKKQIEENLQKQQEQIRKENYRRRLQLTKLASTALESGKIPEAIDHYQKYLEVLASRFNCSFEQLTPRLFDSKEDQMELLLASGVIWDLVRTLDKLKDKDKDFKFYLNKYIQFSIGTNHMVLSAETMRKYLKTPKAKHIKELSDAHNMMRAKMGRCFIASAVFAEDAPEVKSLQKFRDDVLLKNQLGRGFVHLYYTVSPPFADFIDRSVILKPILRLIFQTFILPFTNRFIA